MKLTDLIRDIADLIDNSAKFARSFEEPTNDENPVMIPPLQAKLEILKKSEGLPNSIEDHSQEDNSEIDNMRKMAGITVAKHIASEDNDVLG